MNIYSLFVYDYTYFNWLAFQGKYVYQSRLLEYIKSFGSLFNFGWLFFFPRPVPASKESGNRSEKNPCSCG